MNIEDYILNHIGPEDPVLSELYRKTHLKFINPRMVSGTLQGKFLEIISKIIRPDYILEIGTFTGYSSICLAKGLSENGQLHTIEINDEYAGFTEKYFKKAKLQDKITQHIGNALDILPTFQHKFDLIFVDGAKEEYPEYYKLVKPLLSERGIILADNVLWNGKVLQKINNNDKFTNGVIEFNKTVANDPDVEKVILPLRDGITIIRKKHD